ncbi:radical SAM protein [Clostridioides difficile]|nr:radical SAM protein [Clostridioides difficile]
MFYTGIDPLTMKPVYVPKSKRDKAMQRALLQYRAPRNYDLVYSALVEAGREDLIGFGHRCLIKPKSEKPYFNRNNSKKNVSKGTNKNKKTNTNNRINKNQQKSSTRKKKKH